MLRVGRSHNFIAECEQTGPHGKLYGNVDQWNAASFGFNYVAEQVGGAQKCPEYAQTRLQFARPIGSFQAVKHKCADMLVGEKSDRPRFCCRYARQPIKKNPVQFSNKGNRLELNEKWTLYFSPHLSR